MEENTDCPYKRLNCERHGNCLACKEHHINVKKYGTACERAEKKKKKSKS